MLQRSFMKNAALLTLGFLETPDIKHDCSEFSHDNILWLRYSPMISCSAVKQLIASKIRGFFLHNMCVCSVYIYYVYINTHTYSIYFENIYVYIYIHIIYIINKCIYYIKIKYFSEIYTCMCVYLYIHNKYTQYTYIYYVNKKKRLFWMRLIAINHLTALLSWFSQKYSAAQLFSTLLIIRNVSWAAY